jgi:hypothetical protein
MKLFCFFILFIIGSCNYKKEDKQIASQNKMPPPPPPTIINFWNDSSNVKLNVQSKLVYTTKKIEFDSVRAIAYTGFEEGKVFFPINNSGQWASSITKVKNLEANFEDSFTSILGNALSFKNPMIVSCYEPRFAIVYYKESSVIAQTMICIDCARISSTIKLGNNSYGGALNEGSVSKLAKLIYTIFPK